MYGRLGNGEEATLSSLELCYYQVIEAAIELGLPRVEAGAQGDHKLARGYMPTLTLAPLLPSSARAISPAGWRLTDRTYISLCNSRPSVTPSSVAQQRPQKQCALKATYYVAGRGPCDEHVAIADGLSAVRLTFVPSETVIFC